MHIQTSRVSITNVRTCEKSSRADLAECLNAFQMGQMFFSTDFPSKESDLHVITEKLINHSAGTDNNIRNGQEDDKVSSIDDLVSQLQKKLSWTDSKDVWSCSFEPVWVDFYGACAVGSNRPVSFLDAFPVTLWLHVAPKSSTNKPANIHALVHVKNLVSVQINHYQLLFILREFEKISEMTTFLAVDSKKISNDDSGSVIIGALLSQVEVTLIVPSQTPGKENSGGDLESFVPDTSSIKRLNTSNDVETPQSEVSPKLIMPIEPTGQPVVTFKSDLKIDELNKESSFHDYNPDEYDLLIRGLKNKPKLDTTPSIQNNFNAGLSSMKKGFANLMTSIDSALKASPEDGSSDTVSMRSDLSSDSENYVVVTLEEERGDSIFAGLNTTGITTVEEASEVIEETPETQSEKSMDSACKRKDLVSTITFKLAKIEVVQQSSGLSTAIKVQVAKIGCEECSSIPWDELQNKFCSRSRGWTEVQSDNDCRACIKLRLCRDLKSGICNEDLMNLENNSETKNTYLNADCPSREGLMGLFENNLNAKITDINLIMAMSSLTGLIDLVEDEIIPDPLPMEIYLENTCIRLNEDRPPINITSPGPVPIDLTISKLKISRDKNGIFHIDSAINNTQINDVMSSTETELINLQQSTKQLQTNNDELKRRIAALEKLSQENSRLKRNQDELEYLKSTLSGAQNYIAELLKEKQALQETAGLLQQQLGKMSANSSRTSWSMKR